MILRITNPRNGTEIAGLSQFGVNPDPDVRRPTPPWPDGVRSRAGALIVQVG
jgi:hypothetical protein